ATIPSTNRIFLRRSGVARADRKALSTRGTSSASPMLVPANSLADPWAGRKRNYDRRGNPVERPCSTDPVRCVMTLTVTTPSAAGPPGILHGRARACLYSCAETEPPAASSFSRAPVENLFAVTSSLMPFSSPPPRILICSPLLSQPLELTLVRTQLQHCLRPA